MSASSFSGFPADARILGLDIGSISVDVVLLDGLGTPLYSRYVRHHGQPDKVLCAELEALERTHAGIAAAVTGTGADRVARLLGACAVNEVIAQVAAASFRYPQARSVIDIGGQTASTSSLSPPGRGAACGSRTFRSAPCARPARQLPRSTGYPPRPRHRNRIREGRAPIAAPPVLPALLGLCQVGHDPPPAERAPP